MLGAGDAFMAGFLSDGCATRRWPNAEDAQMRAARWSYRVMGARRDPDRVELDTFCSTALQTRACVKTPRLTDCIEQLPAGRHRPGSRHWLSITRAA